MKTRFYIEAFAKKAASDLVNNFTEDNVRLLHEVLTDYLDANVGRIVLPSEQTVKAVTRVAKPVARRSTATSVTRDLILDQFVEGAKSGTQTFEFKPDDFGISYDQLLRLCRNLNSHKKKLARFPDLLIKSSAKSDSVVCKISRKEPESC